MEADAKFLWKNVAQVKEELGVKKVYNADQSGVCLEYLPKHTISEKGAKTVWVRCGGKDKERLTETSPEWMVSRAFNATFIRKDVLSNTVNAKLGL
ncbi:hypothetical protein F443_14257 [Phytophthora nicotianae P1569]|uniref:Uncharacterized protein n=1 Tax=Phytophthora nicotianae P1569 TaxID=1317065 RepID=V9EP90_PHYNI|nr:hypothetical protein F443_14257 [Phytophthora nicotianae P1569]